MPEATVSPDLLQSLQVFSQLVIQTVGQDLKHNTTDLSLNIKPESHLFNIYLTAIRSENIRDHTPHQYLARCQYHLLLTAYDFNHCCF